MGRADSWAHRIAARAPAGRHALTTIRQAVSASTTRGSDRMASVEQETSAAVTNGAAGDIAVENPATGQVIAHVPDLGPDAVAEMARRGRAAQPAWEALG